MLFRSSVTAELLAMFWALNGATRTPLRASSRHRPVTTSDLPASEVVPQTNLQTFRTTVRSQHAWLPVTTTASTALTPGNTPPAQISTQGQFDSPRGCRGTFGSVGTANASRIEADFTGVDCNQATFTGSVVLTKN